MRNRLMMLLICAAMVLPVSAAYAEEDISEQQDEASLADLKEAEKGIQLLQERLRKREYGLMKEDEYTKVKTEEMKKCGELKKEIWKMRDTAKALAAKLEKLEADRKKAETELTAQTEAYRKRESERKALEDETVSGSEQFKRLSEVCKKEAADRNAKIEKLRSDVQSSEERMDSLTKEMDRIEDDLRSKSAEYEAESNKLAALKARLALDRKEGGPGKDVMPAKDESAQIKEKMDGLMETIQKWETAKQKLSDDMVTAAAKKKAQEEEIKKLENENISKDKELKSLSADLEKEKSTSQEKIEKLKQKALSARSKMRSAAADVKKLEEEVEKATLEKRKAEKEIITKTKDLKVRIAVLLEGYDQSNLSDNRYYTQVQSGKEASKGKGEELTAKMNRVFNTLEEENDRLMAENKKMKTKLERAENAAVAARRQAEAAMKAPEELKAKLNKERLDAHFNLAVVYEKNGLWHDAEREYIKCLRINPKDPEVHYNLGILYDDKLNRNNKAMYHYYKFLSLRPMGETAERVRDWITKIELENRLGKELR